jgi:hypothetical protein
MSSRAGRRTEATLAQQALALRQFMPAGSIYLRPTSLRWTGSVRPTPQTHDYQLQISLAPGESPSTRVLFPALQPDDQGRLPHVFEDGSLCLNRRGEWRSVMLLTDSVLPWACEWLTFYELWRATGIWYGDGPEHLDAEAQDRILHRYS